MSTAFRKGDNSDVLGDEGRKVLNACVKVKIYGKPKTRKYDSGRAQQLFRECYVHQMGVGFQEFSYAKRDEEEKTYSVVDIHNAMVKYEDMPYVQIYPKEGPGSVKMRELIDKRRADVERELEEAKANSVGKKMYSWTVAQRRVRDCYAGNFPEDKFILSIYDELFSIKDIEEGLAEFEKESIEIFSNQRKITDEKVLAHRATIQKKYQNALVSPGTLYKCGEEEALESFKKCYPSAFPLFDRGYHDCYTCALECFCIFKLYNKVCKEDVRLLQLCKYPAEGPGSKELRESIERHRTDLQKEYQNFCNCEKSQLPDRKYSKGEAERRVRDCFASGIPGDSDVFPIKKDESGMPKIYQTYDIFDIKQSLDYFDSKKFLVKYPEEGHISDEIKKCVDEQRELILSEYKIATAHTEIEHGSGFLISDHFILTNKHVIQIYLDDKDSYAICISNAAIGELHCEVAHTDPGKDLALLYCSALNLPQCRISPVQLSTQPLLPGMQIFSFGYPISHTEETALFVTGNVSGSKRNPSGHSMVVLNCALNSGNSGGPVLSWVDGQVKVVGIATQKHFKEILTFDEIETIENIRKSLQTQTITDVPKYDLEHLSRRRTLEVVPGSCQVSMHLLTLKLYDALETHSQFNLSNALPGDLVAEFIKNSIHKYNGEHKEELVKVAELSQ